MFTILIVEDEQPIREEIVMGISWKDIQIDKVLQADNGEEALNIALQTPIDILLTDIRMPRLNGIELSRKIREIYSDCAIIFISAYSDKEYLISAIQIKCSDYIEKPVQIDKLNSTLEEAVSSCQKAVNKKFRNIMLQNNLKISIPLIINEIAVQAENKNADWDLLAKCTNNEMLDIDLSAYYLSVIVQFIKNTTYDDLITKKSDRLNSMQSLVDIFLSSGLKCLWGTRDDETYVLHVSSKYDNLNQARIEQILKKWCNQADRKKFCSIGSVVQSFKEIPESYICAKQALGKCFFRGYGSIVCYTPEVTKATLSEKEFLDQFSQALENAKHTTLSAMIQNFCLELQKCENVDIEEIRFFFSSLVVKVMNRLQIISTKESNSSGNYRSFLERIQNDQTLLELRDCLLNLIDMYFKQLNVFNSNSNITTILSYIGKYYNENSLDISRISQNTFLSPAYLCTYFKRETGKTINQYITDFRLNKSIEFLKDKQYRISNVAALVGYDDGNYFARLFKKKFGQSPSEYRERLGITE